MPTNKKSKGMRSPSHVLNSFGVWVRSKFAGMRVLKNTLISDIQMYGVANARKLPSRKKTHTSPIVRTEHNDGHDNKTRMRHAVTKRRHGIKKLQA